MAKALSWAQAGLRGAAGISLGECYRGLLDPPRQPRTFLGRKL